MFGYNTSGVSPLPEKAAIIRAAMLEWIEKAGAPFPLAIIAIQHYDDEENALANSSWSLHPVFVFPEGEIDTALSTMHYASFRDVLLASQAVVGTPEAIAAGPCVIASGGDLSPPWLSRQNIVPMEWIMEASENNNFGRLSRRFHRQVFIVFTAINEKVIKTIFSTRNARAARECVTCEHRDECLAPKHTRHAPLESKLAQLGSVSEVAFSSSSTMKQSIDAIMEQLFGSAGKLSGNSDDNFDRQIDKKRH
jgi:hypothetical protein